jgi:transcriptional regulator with XRE-family HTH domain
MDDIGVDGVAVGERVREEREKRGWSARALARAAGVSHSYVSHLEGGYYPRPGVDKLRRIANGLEVPLESLIGAEDGEVARGSPELEGIQVNLMAISELDPDALKQLAEIIEAVKEKAERQYREERRATRARQRSAQPARQPD